MRATTSDDAARLAEIWLDVAEYYAALDPDSFRVPRRDDVTEVEVGGASDGTLSIVAEIDGKVVGFLDAHFEEPVPHAAAQFVSELSEHRVVVDALAVDRSQWRRGVGSTLLRAAEKWARDGGARVVCLNTYVESPVSVPFYERRMGYERQSINLRKRL